MPKNASTKISDEIKRKIQFKLLGVGELHRRYISVSDHHIVAASEKKDIMRNSQDECVRWSGGAVGITV